VGSSNSFTVCPTSQKKLSAAHDSEYIDVPYSDGPFLLGVPAMKHVSKAQLMNVQETVKEIKTIQVKTFYTFNEATADQNEIYISMNDTTINDCCNVTSTCTKSGNTKSSMQACNHTVHHSGDVHTV